MASSKVITAEQHKNSNFELFTCLWLDQNVNTTDDNRETLNELRKVINHLQTFHKSDECEQYIRHITKEKVVLIVSGSLGRQIVPRLHDLPQFIACYVFCQDQKANEQWANKFHKVNGVFVDRSKLVARIAKDQTARARVEDGASISVISSGSQSLETRNAIFMWFQLFIEVLLRMHHKSADRKELLDICKNSYKGNQEELNIINEFEKDYKSEKAIWWYTRESCFYRMMNKALRVQDFDMLFAFRFFITDIAKQLKTEYENFLRTSDTRSKVRVYRGQVIGSDEFNLMKKNIGEFLSMNSFLSTSRNRSTALHFARSTPTTDGAHRIIFEIEINPRLQTKPFANVTAVSYFQNEDEVLIMLGALFRIDKVTENKQDHVWDVCVSLASEDDYHLKDTFAYMKQKIGEDTDLDSLGKILIEMGEYDQAKKCYDLVMRDSQLSLCNAYHGLSRAIFDKDIEQTLKYALLEQSIKESIFSKDHVELGILYSWIGGVHYQNNNYEEALIYLNKALTILENNQIIDYGNLSSTYHRLALTYYERGDHASAIMYFNKTLTTQQTFLPANHPKIAQTYNNLGVFYKDRGDHLRALQYYEKSLSIYRKTLPPNHSDVIRTENNIRQLKIDMNQ